jgi:tripartite ATP-independent transporter DctM subunit
MTISHILCAKYNFDPPKPFAGLRHLLVSAVRALPALFLPILILGGILGGFFSPTGASAVAAIYAIFVGYIYYRTLKLSDLPGIFMLVAKNSAMILFLIGSAQVFAWLVTYFNMVTAVTEMFLSVTQSPVVFLLIVNAILLVMGMFFDMSFSIIVLGPLMVPVAQSLGIDPVHFGLVMCINLCIGLSTPPYGLCLFAICGVSKGLSFTGLSRAILPFIVAELVVLLIITYCEFFTLALPRFFGYA